MISNRVLSRPAFCSSSRKIGVEKRSVLEVREHRKQRFDAEIGQKAKFRKNSNLWVEFRAPVLTYFKYARAPRTSFALISNKIIGSTSKVLGKMVDRRKLKLKKF